MIIFFGVGYGFLLRLEVLAPTVARHVIPCGPGAVLILKITTAADKQRVTLPVIIVMTEDLMNNPLCFFSNV